MLILRRGGGGAEKIKQEKEGGKKPFSQGKAQTLETRSEPPPCSISSHTIAKANNNPSTYRTFQTFLSSANSGARMRDSVGTCQFLFMSSLPPQRLLGPRPALSLKDLSNFKMGPFLGLLSRHWGGLLNLLPPAWVLPKDFFAVYILREQSNSSNMKGHFTHAYKVEKDWKILCSR